MKLSSRTLEILKNFADINTNLIVDEGNVLKTINPAKTIVGYAEVEETFSKMAIYDLKAFISTISVFKDTDLDFHDKFVTISSGKESINYTYAEAQHLISAPSSIKFPKANIKFDLTKEVFEKALKAIRVLRSPYLCFVGNGEVITLLGTDVKNPNGNSYKIDLCESDETFRAVFEIDNIKMIPGNYSVTISDKGLAKFETTGLTYYNAVDKKKSNFN